MSNPPRCTARVGIATGLVVVGDLIGEGSAQEQSVVGETPNLAARLQVLAEPEAVVIDNFTIPSQLKAWIDRILIAGKTFRYSEAGLVGLAGGRRRGRAAAPARRPYRRTVHIRQNSDRILSSMRPLRPRVRAHAGTEGKCWRFYPWGPRCIGLVAVPVSIGLATLVLAVGTLSRPSRRSTFLASRIASSASPAIACVRPRRGGISREMIPRSAIA